MNPSRPLAAALTAAVMALSLGLSAPTSAAPAPRGAEAPSAERVAPQARARLSYSPRRFIGGQAITFSGRLPVTGKRVIRLQQNMNRAGDDWFAVRGFRGRSKANGSFRFQVPAPSAFGISYRVVAGRAKTPGVRLTARSQDLTLTPERTADGFEIDVDTTPRLRQRSDLDGTPVQRGRDLTLQVRDEDFEWTTVARGEVNRFGNDTFRVDEAGVYRVRQEAVTRGANDIGWYPSFPTYVGVGVDARSVADTAARGAVSPQAGTTQTAASRYRWGRPRFDFAWEGADSLTSRPNVGAKRGYGWEDYSNGTGRVAPLNGGLSLESGRNRGGGPNRGTTTATLRGGYAQTYGRWEARLREVVTRGGDQYRFLVQLVDADSSYGGCSGDAITLASIEGSSTRMTFGVQNGARRYSDTTAIRSIRNTVPALGVEVARDHITWFLDGRAIGTVRDSAAISNSPKTLRLALVGKGADDEMAQTYIISDWQRGYGLGKRQVRNGGSLDRVDPVENPAPC